MKKILLLLFALVLLKTAHAQVPIDVKSAFSGGFELGIPSHNAFSIGLGGSIKGELHIVQKFSLTLTGGYSSFFHKSSIFTAVDTEGPAQFFPLKGGVRYFVGTDLYLEGELGTALETNYDKAHLFAWSVGPGFNIPINEHRGVDLSFRYESWSQHTLQQTAIRIAYRWQ